ncbi:glycosyltransferase [Tamlana sp. 2_MG-2023]|uniref:glycosyltransferase n=1 Tax=unclassified Tamlana TaxID=2614803 RepID=UPI0026E22A70|nr:MULTISPECIES: glycosyltransferase [unclassified Tamlana]MDO6760247.1 glycosyltransferase [Tamlana sp. 2_MG-2023]MDO6790055.1 glycosyltransferase [Tamlana sp. 1_MG-2023]
MEKIITNSVNGYPEVRNIFSRYPNYAYKKDLFNYGLKLTHRITGKGYHPFWKGLFYYPKDQVTPCVFFNTINLGKNVWCVYFETTLPRLGGVGRFFYNMSIKQLTKENCKEIIAISQCAYNMQITYLKDKYPQYLDIIQAKMKVQLPPQEPLINSYSEKKLPDSKIVFTLIGADFFRKGGREILQVFDMLIPQHPQLQLNIVSSMKYEDYATHATKQDLDSAKYIINKYPNNILHYNSLPNAKVLELLKNTHIGLLPTWADSFGYSVLESQAAGCPVITTDIRALPEINNNNIGWLIQVEKKIDKNALIDTKNQRFMFSNHLKLELKRIITSEILNTPNNIKIKGEKALFNIKKMIDEK